MSDAIQPLILYDCTARFTLPIRTRDLMRMLWQRIALGSPLGVNFVVKCAEVHITSDVQQETK